MFENIRSLPTSGGSKKNALSLESLEDRTVPAVVGTIGTSITQSPLLNQAFLAESARLDLVQGYLGMVEASRGSNAQARAFGQQLSTAQLSAFNQIAPTLAAQGISVQLSSFDMFLVNELPTLSAANIDSQFLALSTMYSFQSATLDQTEEEFGSNSATRAFAQAQLQVTQQELLTEINLLGPTGASDMLELFELLGGFTATTGVGSPVTTGFGAIGSPGTTGFGTLGGTTATGIGGANFGANNGSSSSNTNGNTATGVGGANFGANNGLNPTNTNGATATGVGGANFGTNNGLNPTNTSGSTASGVGGANFGTTNGFGAGGTTGF